MSEVIQFDIRWRGLASNPYLTREWRNYLIGPDHPRFMQEVTPKEPGVYFLYLDGQLTYIGQSYSIRSRLAEHRKNGRPFDEAGFVLVPADLALHVEIAYIHALRPPGNRLVEPPVYLQHFRLFDAIVELWRRSASATVAC